MPDPAAPLTAPQVAHRRRHALGFRAVAYAFLVVMASSTVLSPLYGLYEERDGFSSFVVTVIYATYAVGVIVSLIFAGHLSDWHGRRRLLLPAIALSALSALTFLLWRDLPGLLVARVLNGLGVGVVTATATAYLAELLAEARPGHAARAQLVAGAVNLGGLGLGPLVGGALAEWVGSPLTVPFAVSLGALLVALVLVALTPETRTKLDPLPAYRPQRVAVPDADRGRFVAAAIGAFISFGALGLFTGLAGTLLIGAFDVTARVTTGVTIFVVYLAAVLAQAVAQRWELRRVLAVGIGAMLVGLALTVLAAWLADPSYLVFLIGGAITGAGSGLVFKGALGVVVEVAPPEGRGEALAGLFLAGYIGLSVPVLGAGVLLQSASPRVTLLVFGVLVGLAIAAVAPRLLRR